MTDRFEIVKPDNFHLHLRDGEMLSAVLPFTTAQFGKAIVMPNLKPPIVNAADAIAYRNRILESLPEGAIDTFRPLMTLYLTDKTTPEMIAQASASGLVYAVKYYPAGATTNSDSGLTKIENAFPVFEKMEELGMPLLLHGEVVDLGTKVKDLERSFVSDVLEGLTGQFPGLKMVLEHITTKEAVQFVESSKGPVAATVTPQHLLMCDDDLARHRLTGKMGNFPHNFCLPVLKDRDDLECIRKTVMQSDNRARQKFFAGTDSAPHVTSTKETSCGCAGCFCEPAALAVYAQVFEEYGGEDWVSKLEAFTSKNGAAFYGLSENEGKLTLVREDWTVPERVQVMRHTVPRKRIEDVSVTPWLAGETLRWRVLAE